MSLIVSGIVVCGVLIISVAIYILSAIGWRAYQNRILSSPPTSNRPIEKIECAMFRRLKPDLIAFSYKKGISAANHDQNDEEEGSCDNSTSTCIVCLRHLENEELVRQLPKCKHTFHAPCLDMWLDAHSGCPLCRIPIDRLPQDETVALTPHGQEKNSQEVTVIVDNIRNSMPSISIIM